MRYEDVVAEVRAKLAAIQREQAERAQLIDNRVAEALRARETATTRLRRDTDETMTRLRDERKRVEAAGGWVTEKTTADAGEVEEADFGFEEDEDEAVRRAGYRVEPSSPAPSIPVGYAPPPPSPPPAATPPPPVQRRRARRADDDDDDFDQHKWWAG